MLQDMPKVNNGASSGGGNLSVVYGTVTWSSSGINIPTTKKAIGVSMLVNTGYWSNPVVFAFSTGEVYNNGNVDTTHPFVFTDNSISCSVAYDSNNRSIQYYVIYD